MHAYSAVQFSQQDLDLFCQASGDRNPLHMSKEYASKTAYGQQVVFGAIGCLACFSRVRKEDGRVKKVVADFHRPMFLQVEYRLEETRSGGALVVRLFDGSVPVVTTTVHFSTQESVMDLAFPEGEAAFPRENAEDLRWGDLQKNMEVSGVYEVNSEGLSQLHRRWSLKLAPAVARAMLWCSYLVGMELPGRNALFFRAALEFKKDGAPHSELDFRAQVTSLNSSLQQMKSTIELSSKGDVVATGVLTAFVRPDVPRLNLFDLRKTSGQGLAGKVAVVLGASRGLGAALAMAMASQGAHVLAVARSEAVWKDEIPPELTGAVTFLNMDVGDLDCMRDLAARVEREFGKLDFLLCSAFPAIPPYRLEVNASARIQGYIQQATQMVLSPLCAMLPQLNASEGQVVLISSAAVEHPVRDWPHYVAAKSAVEAICRIAPMQFPATRMLIVRPERLLTEMTNTPMGRQGAVSPEKLADSIVRKLQQPSHAGTCEWFSATDRVEEQADQRVLEALAL